MKSAPCKDCEKRELGCHSKCEKYKEYRKQHDALSELKRSKEDFENWFAKRTERIAKKQKRQ